MGAEPRWGVFGNLAFTVILIASSVSNVGVAMCDTAMHWLMTSLNPDPMMVSAVQVATTLPMFLLTLPAGVLADIVDPRRLLIGSQIFVVAVSVAFAALVSLDVETPKVLLATNFVLVAGGALAAPTWLLITPMLVPKDDLDSAIAINNTSYNVSRAIGPALGDFTIAAFSIGFPFWVLLRRQSRAPRRGAVAPRSPPLPGDAAGRAPDERAADGAALCPPQPRHGCNAHPGRRLLPVRERVLGASASDRAQPDA